MSANASTVQDTSNLEYLHSMACKCYGINETDNADIDNFATQISDALKNIVADATEKNVTEIINIGNKIPSYAGLMIMERVCAANPDDVINGLLAMNKYHDAMVAKDPESTKTTDAYETMGCLIMYCTGKVLRRFITTDFETAKKIVIKMRKRPAVAAIMMARLAELYVSSKADVRYSAPIIENLNETIKYLESFDGSVADIPDAIGISYKQLKNIIRDFMERGNKRESLKKINKLVNKKADVGQLFYNFVITNPGCALKVIDSAEFDKSIIEKFMKQLRVQHSAEIGILLKTINAEKYAVIQSILKSEYNTETINDYYDKLSDLINRKDMNQYGILLRYVGFMPIAYTTAERSEFDALSELQSKLSAVANNLTATIGDKSLSMTVVPMSRSRLHSDIIAQLNKEKGISADGGSSHLAKLMDKDIVKKIREASASYLAVDQLSGATVILILDTLCDVVKSGKTIATDMQVIISEAYKIMIMKHGIITTKDYFSEVASTFLSKVQPYSDINNIDDDDDNLAVPATDSAATAN